MDTSTSLRIEQSCDTILALWHESTAPPRTPGATGTSDLGPREPSKATAPRAEAHRCLAHWAHVLVDAVPECVAAGDVIDANDTLCLARFLKTEADTIAGCLPITDATFCAEELEEAARGLVAVARPPEHSSIHLGTCPMPMPREDGTTEPCGAHIRATPHWDAQALAEDGVAPRGAWVFAGQIICPRCATSETLDWWQQKILGDQEPVTSDELRAQLRRRMGITASAMAVRHWAARGIVAPVGKDEHGRNLYDLLAAMRALRHRAVERAPRHTHA